MLNLQLAKAYLLGTDSAIAKRTWRDAIEALTATKQGANHTQSATQLRFSGLSAMAGILEAVLRLGGALDGRRHAGRPSSPH